MHPPYLCTVILAQGQNSLAVLAIDDLTNSVVNGGQATENTLVACNHGDGIYFIFLQFFVPHAHHLQMHGTGNG